MARRDEPVTIDVIAANPVSRRVVVGLVLDTGAHPGQPGMADFVKKLNAVVGWLLDGGLVRLRPDVRGFVPEIQVVLVDQPSSSWLKLLEDVAAHVTGQSGIAFELRFLGETAG